MPSYVSYFESIQEDPWPRWVGEISVADFARQVGNRTGAMARLAALRTEHRVKAGIVDGDNVAADEAAIGTIMSHCMGLYNEAIDNLALRLREVLPDPWHAEPGERNAVAVLSHRSLVIELSYRGAEFVAERLEKPTTKRNDKAIRLLLAKAAK